MEYEKLISLAYKAMENAYVPYSKFAVGAALLCEDGEVYLGCNVECATYGGTNCAERTALFKAVSEGKREFKAIAVVSRTRDYTFPCGICRQVLSEFCRDLDVIMAKGDKFKVYKLSELLPYAFDKSELLK